MSHKKADTHININVEFGDGGRIISIYSRNAANDVLDIIESNVINSIPILHWFSGNMQEVERANTFGCWFSISPAMLLGKKGKNLVSKMPLSKILPETDAPFTENVECLTCLGKLLKYLIHLKIFFILILSK